MKDLKIGLVFSGGGAKGAYQLGIWKAMEEFGFSKQVMAVSGSSVGALNGFMFVYSDYESAEYMWMNQVDHAKLLRSHSGKQRKHLDFTVGLLGWLPLFGELSGKSFNLASEYLDYLYHRDNMQSWFSNSGIAELITQANKDIKFGKTRYPLFYACAYEFMTLKPKYFKIDAITDRVHSEQVLLASSAIPILYPPIKINGMHYYDGSCIDNSPIYPLSSLGLDLIIVINIEGSSTSRDFMHDFPGENILEIKPFNPLGGMLNALEFSSNFVYTCFDQGYTQGQDIFRELSNQLSFSNKPAVIRSQVQYFINSNLNYYEDSNLSLQNVSQNLKDFFMLIGDMPNLSFPTMGGDVFWDTLEYIDGYKLQQNKTTGHYRILDSSNVRISWGSEIAQTYKFHQLTKANYVETIDYRAQYKASLNTNLRNENKTLERNLALNIHKNFSIKIKEKTMKPIAEQKAEYLKLCNTLEPLNKKYIPKNHELTDLKKGIESFQAFVPLIGAYSAGKSSLLNSFLQKEIFKVEIDPTTQIAFEVFWADKDKFEIITDGESTTLTAKQIIDEDYNDKPDSICRVALNNKALENYPNIAIVDLPGLHSGHQTHSIAIDNYINKSTAYFLIIDAESSLRSDLVIFMKELKAFNVPVYCLISKSDKLPSDEVQNVKESINSGIIKHFGRAPDGIGAVSAFDDDTEVFRDFLSELEDRAGELLVYNYNDKLRAYLVDLENAIHNMIDFSELDDSEFDRSEKDVNRQFEEAKRKIPEHLRVNRTIISDSQIKWSHHIRQEIENNIDTLVNAYLAGRTINSEITHICRRAYREGFDLYVSPVILKYSDKLREISSEIQIGNISLSPVKEEPKKDVSPMPAGTLSVVLTGLSQIPGIGPILAVVGGILFAIFERSDDSNTKQGDQKEQIERQIRNEVIPNMMGQIEQHISQSIQENLLQMNEKTNLDLENKKKQLDDSLAKIKKDRQIKREDFEKQKQKWIEDLEKVRKIYADLE